MESSVSSPLRNLSLAAGKNEPNLPNRSTRPRLRSVRWVREPIDEPEVYPLGPGSTGKRPVRPCGPSRLGIHCLDRARQSVRFGPLSIYKEPNVVLSIVSDPAAQYVSGTAPGRYFAVWIVTNQMEKAIASFEMAPGEYQPELHVDELAVQDLALADGEHKPLVIVEEGSIQSVALTDSEHRPDVRIDEQAAQDASVAAGSHSPELNVTEKAQAAYDLLSGDFRPMVFINEPASQLVGLADGEHFLELRVQEILEQVAQDLTLGPCKHDVPIFELIVSDHGTLEITTPDGRFTLFYPSDDMEAYTAGAQLNGLNSGSNWTFPYVDRSNVFGIQVSDPMEDYADAALLNGLNLGFWTDHPYVARDNITALNIVDNMESYADSALVNGLNGGLGFAGAYVDRENFIIVSEDEDFESYSVQSPVTDTLNGGPRGWSGPWVFSPVVYPNFVGDEDFEAYTVQNPVVDVLNAGSGWSAAWSLSGDAETVNANTYKLGGATDNFETYADENPVASPLSGGGGWAGNWLIGGDTSVKAVDTFEDYADENPVSSTLNSGTNWAGAWVIG